MTVYIYVGSGVYILLFKDLLSKDLLSLENKLNGNKAK